MSYSAVASPFELYMDELLRVFLKKNHHKTSVPRDIYETGVKSWMCMPQSEKDVYYKLHNIHNMEHQKLRKFKNENDIPHITDSSSTMESESAHDSENYNSVSRQHKRINRKKKSLEEANKIYKKKLALAPTTIKYKKTSNHPGDKIMIKQLEENNNMVVMPPSILKIKNYNIQLRRPHITAPNSGLPKYTSTPNSSPVFKTSVDFVRLNGTSSPDAKTEQPQKASVISTDNAKTSNAAVIEAPPQVSNNTIETKNTKKVLKDKKSMTERLLKIKIENQAEIDKLNSSNESSGSGSGTSVEELRKSFEQMSTDLSEPVNKPYEIHSSAEEKSTANQKPTYLQYLKQKLEYNKEYNMKIEQGLIQPAVVSNNKKIVTFKQPQINQESIKPDNNKDSFESILAKPKSPRVSPGSNDCVVRKVNRQIAKEPMGYTRQPLGCFPASVPIFLPMYPPMYFGPPVSYESTGAYPKMLGPNFSQRRA